MKRYDACELSHLLEIEYGKEFNVPYCIMENLRKIDLYVENKQADAGLLNDFLIKGEGIDNITDVFQELVNDLCFRGKLEEGEYFLSFDD